MGYQMYQYEWCKREYSLIELAQACEEAYGVNEKESEPTMLCTLADIDSCPIAGKIGQLLIPANWLCVRKRIQYYFQKRGFIKMDEW